MKTFILLELKTTDFIEALAFKKLQEEIQRYSKMLKTLGSSKRYYFREPFRRRFNNDLSGFTKATENLIRLQNEARIKK